MFRTILVAVDGSSIAERAVPYATRLAGGASGSLVLVRAVVHTSAEDHDAEAAEAYLAGLTQQLTAAGIAAEHEVLHGAPVEAILETAARRQASCIVMGTHGRTGLPELMVGSVAEAVLAHSPVPVLLITKQLAESAFPHFDPAHSRVLVPLDGSPFAEAALLAAEELLAPDGTMVLTRVVPTAADVATWPDDTDLAYLDDPQRALDQEGREYLEEVAADLRASRPGRAILIDVRAGRPAESIATAAREHDASLVVMAAHGRTGLRRLVAGSITGEVLRQAQSPLLLIHSSLDHQREVESPRGSAS